MEVVGPLIGLVMFLVAVFGIDVAVDLFRIGRRVSAALLSVLIVVAMAYGLLEFSALSI